MKINYIIIAFSLLIGVGAVAQEDAEMKDDTIRMKMGNKTIIIIGDDLNEDEFDFDWEDDTAQCCEGGLSSTVMFDIGMNGYLTGDNSMALPTNQQLMELNYSRSRTFGMSLMLTNADIIKDRVYVMPGIGFNWNNYHFKNEQLQITTGSDTTMFYVDSNQIYDKFKLRSTYVQVPLLVGLQLGNPDNTPINIQFGVIGGFKIGSKIKQRYYIDNTEYEDKVRDDFNINPFKFSATARIGIGDFGLFANMSLTTLFERNKAPELYPFSMGVTFGGF